MIPKSTRKRSAILWTLAILMMLGAAVYQRRTGPTCPMRAPFSIGGDSYRCKLIRSEVTTKDAEVTLPAPASPVDANLHYRRLGTKDLYTTVPMEVSGDHLVGHLPAQPPAGKLEYHVTLESPDGATRIPASPDEQVVIRFKGAVPVYVLAPHVLFMFTALLVGLRTGLAALFLPHQTVRLAVVTIVGLTLGGMILGPIVQKHAFGEFWTGWPNGKDLTDNKTLIMWGVWLLVGGALLLWWRAKPRLARVAVVLAALVMIAVYMIPHSLRGSTLDYEKLDRGVPAQEAIRTG